MSRVWTIISCQDKLWNGTQQVFQSHSDQVAPEPNGWIEL